MTLVFKDIPVSEIHAHPNNVRVDVGDLTELIDSVKAKGILQALTVTPHPGVPGEFLLIAGHRRLAAARRATVSLVPCIVNSDLSTETEQLEAMLVENLQRVDISPIEEARAYQHLLDLPGYDIKRLAKSTGRSQRMVKERVKLGQLNTDQADGVHEGTLTIERALVLVDFADDPDAVLALERVPARDQSTWDVEVKRLQRARDWREGLPQLRKDLEAAGAELVDAPEGNTWSWTDYYAVYDASEDVAKNVENGYLAIVDDETRHPYLNKFEAIIWVRRRGQQQAAAAASRPEPSAEEAAQAKRVADIRAALQIAAEVREAHVLERIKKVTHATARTALEDLVRDSIDVRRLAWVLGIHITEDTDDQEIFDALPKLTLEQLALLTHFNHFEAEATLSDIYGWNPSTYTYEHNSAPWLTALADIYGYQLSDPEKEASAYFAKPKQATENADAVAADEDEGDGS